MKKYRKHIDDFFREKLGWYFETPPADVWDDIGVRLDKVKLKPMVHTAPSHLFRHLAIISSIVVILGVTIVGKIFHNPDRIQNTLITDNRQPVINESTADPANPTYQEAPIAAKTEEPASQNKDAGNNAGAAYDNDSKMNAPVTGKKDALPANENKQQPANTKNKTTSVKKTSTGKDSKMTRGSVQNTTKGGHDNDNNIYNSSNTNAGTQNPATTTLHEGNEENKTINTSNTSVTAPANKPVASANTIKKDSIQNVKKQTADEKKNTPAHQWLKRFEAGVKGGYERGTDNNAATKYVVSPYLQYNISPKFSLMTQPAIKYAGLSSRNIGQNNSYYRVNEDGRLIQDGPTTIATSFEGGNVDTFYTTKYTYTQSHDSIVKSYITGGTYMEFEIPLLLKYALSHKFSVYGGVNIVLSKLTGIRENTYTKNGISRSFDTTITTLGPAAQPLVSNIITYPGMPFSEYKGPLYTSPQESKLTAGYMIGLSYRFNNRWLFDALMLQSPYKPYLIGGYNINNPISLPYFRLTAGYSITK